MYVCRPYVCSRAMSVLCGAVKLISAARLQQTEATTSSRWLTGCMDRCAFRWGWQYCGCDMYVDTGRTNVGFSDSLRNTVVRWIGWWRTNERSLFANEQKGWQWQATRREHSISRLGERTRDESPTGITRESHGNGKLCGNVKERGNSMAEMGSNENTKLSHFPPRAS